MCLTGTPALHADFGWGEAASPAAGLGALKSRGKKGGGRRSCRRRPGRRERGQVGPGPCCTAVPSAPGTAPGSRPSVPRPLCRRPPAPLARVALFPYPAVLLSCCPAVSVIPCPGPATAGSAACEHRWALSPNFCPPPGAAAAVSLHAHTHTHTRTPRRGARPRHAPPQTGRRSPDPLRRRAGVPRRGCPQSGAEGWSRWWGRRWSAAPPSCLCVRTCTQA